jgi:hypothetical protein
LLNMITIFRFIEDINHQSRQPQIYQSSGLKYDPSNHKSTRCIS